MGLKLLAQKDWIGRFGPSKPPSIPKSKMVSKKCSKSIKDKSGRELPY